MALGRGRWDRGTLGVVWYLYAIWTAVVFGVYYSIGRSVRYAVRCRHMLQIPGSGPTRCTYTQLRFVCLSTTHRQTDSLLGTAHHLVTATWQFQRPYAVPSEGIQVTSGWGP